MMENEEIAMEAQGTGKHSMITVITKVDYFAFRRYFYYANARRAAPWLQWLLIFLAAPVYDIVFAVRYAISGEAFPLRMWLLCALTAIGWAYLLLEPRLLYRRRAKEPGAAGCTYIFGETSLLCQAGGSKGPEEEELLYDQLQLVAETRTAFYLHVEKNCYLLPKKCLEKRQLEELRELLRENLGEKFKGRK